MSARWKLWQLMVPKSDKPLALTESWDLAQIIAKRLCLQTYDVTPVFVEVEKIPLDQIHGDVPKETTKHED